MEPQKKENAIQRIKDQDIFDEFGADLLALYTDEMIDWDNYDPSDFFKEFFQGSKISKEKQAQIKKNLYPLMRMAKKLKEEAQNYKKK